VKDIRRVVWRYSSAGEKIRIVLEGPGSEGFIAAITQHVSGKHFEMVRYCADGVPVRVIEAYEKTLAAKRRGRGTGPVPGNRPWLGCLIHDSLVLLNISQ
jgi:hypothetical protein